MKKTRPCTHCAGKGFTFDGTTYVSTSYGGYQEVATRKTCTKCYGKGRK